jgi:transcription antitermination protein NusB
VRSRAREIALQVLFQVEFKDATAEASFELYDDRDQSSMAYARFLAEGALKNKETLDALIEQKSHHWKLKRMDLVDRNILRLACFELLHGEDVSSATVINEAIELAKKFGQKDSGSFINGVLDQIAKSKVS